MAVGTRRDGNLVADLVAGCGDFAVPHRYHDTVDVEKEECAGHAGLSLGWSVGSISRFQQSGGIKQPVQE